MALTLCVGPQLVWLTLCSPFHPPLLLRYLGVGETHNN